MRRWLPFLLSCAPALQAQIGPDCIASRASHWIEFYRDLHRHPELSFRESRTAETLAAALGEAGFEVATHVGGTGVVAVLQNGEGRTLLLRCDMDALPVGEKTGLDYASLVRVESEDGRVAGVMHACGHDLHMTALAATAEWLAAHRDSWRGTLICIGQPAEERAGGAKAMLEDGLLTRFPRPDFALALHVTPDIEAGKVGVCVGPAMANVESVDVIVRGRGGHGAAPHLTIDPIPIACRLVLDLQTVVSREIAPTSPAVLTVGAINGGSKHNIIDDQVHLQITVRSYDERVHEHIKEAIVRKAKAAASSSGAPEPTVEFSEFTPVLLNDPTLTARCADAFRSELGTGAVVDVGPVMTAEDFGRFRLAGIPVCMFRLGTTAAARLREQRARGEELAPLHSGGYYPDVEPSLPTAVRALASATLELLRR